MAKLISGFQNLCFFCSHLGHGELHLPTATARNSIPCHLQQVLRTGVEGAGLESIMVEQVGGEDMSFSLGVRDGEAGGHTLSVGAHVGDGFWEEGKEGKKPSSGWERGWVKSCMPTMDTSGLGTPRRALGSFPMHSLGL